jgi:hypothetical protein
MEGQISYLQNDNKEFRERFDKLEGYAVSADKRVTNIEMDLKEVKEMAKETRGSVIKIENFDFPRINVLSEITSDHEKRLKELEIKKIS